MEREVKAGQVEGPSGLAPVEFLGCLEVFQFLVVCPYLKFVPDTFQEVLPSLLLNNLGRIDESRVG